MEAILAEMDPETLAFKIITFLTFKDEAMRPIDIARELNEKGSSVRARLAELKQDNLVESTGEGYISKMTSYDILMKLFRQLSIE
jgi:Mn-dependent DtxR family transcriptional regulator